ncbi:MAG: NAD/NADP octopine/nopaline dehydrogenase family protein [Terriglobia bacterium]
MLQKRLILKQIGVFGAGNAGVAEATRIKLQFPDVRVVLYNRDTDEKSRNKVKLLRQNEVFHLSGVYNGVAKPDVITFDVEKVVAGSDLIVVTTTANAHGFIASQMVPYLHSGQVILVFAGGIDSKFVMAKKLRQAGCRADVTFADADTFIYATKVIELSPSRVEVLIKAKKSKLYLSVLPYGRLYPVVKNLHGAIYPDQFIACSDPLQSGIGDAPGLHIIGMLGQRALIEAGKEFNFYLGLDAEMTERIEELDRERIMVASTMGIEDSPTTRQFLNTSYGIALTSNGRDRSLFEMVHDEATPYYNKPGDAIRSVAPTKMSHRYLYEEIMTRVVPLYYFGKALSLRTPLHERIIREAGEILGRDYFREGRGLKKLGLSENDVRHWQARKKRFEDAF